MAVAFDPKADYTKRAELLRICTDRGISHEKFSQIVEPMCDLSHEEKEQMAAELIPLVESGIYDSEPRHFSTKRSGMIISVVCTTLTISALKQFVLLWKIYCYTARFLKILCKVFFHYSKRKNICHRCTTG